MPYKAKQDQRSYQQKWFASRREEWIAANGPCAECGGTDSLQVDHVDPATKACNPKALWSRKLSVRLAELKKCQVLCRRCHEAKTKREHMARRKHGTAAMYRFAGCRCDVCKRWKRSSYQ